MVTGMRGLCNGLGPAMFGLIFYLFHVDLNEEHNGDLDALQLTNNSSVPYVEPVRPFVPGPPFVFGSLLVVCALLVAVFIPDGETIGPSLRTPSRRHSGKSCARLRVARSCAVLCCVVFSFAQAFWSVSRIACCVVVCRYIVMTSW